MRILPQKKSEGLCERCKGAGRGHSVHTGRWLCRACLVIDDKQATARKRKEMADARRDRKNAKARAKNAEARGR